MTSAAFTSYSLYDRIFSTPRHSEERSRRGAALSLFFVNLGIDRRDSTTNTVRSAKGAVTVV